MNLTELLQAIANVIREKTGKTDTINAQDFPTEIGNISGGSSDLPEGLLYKTLEKTTSLTVGDVSRPSSCYYMFGDCAKLTSLDVSNFNTSKVTDMSYMFYDCTKLTSLDVSNFNTSKVTNMSYMFYDCTSLTSLDLSSFDTSKVTNMGYMFYNCTKLTSLDLSSFDFTKVTSYTYMLRSVTNCTIYVKDETAKSFITDKVKPDSTCTVVIKE